MPRGLSIKNDPFIQQFDLAISLYEMKEYEKTKTLLDEIIDKAKNQKLIQQAIDLRSKIQGLKLKLAFKIQYKGTHYSGFQSQKNANSIQDELIRAFKQISVDNLQMNYSGRTDKGVHALGQVFDIVVSQDRSDMQWINGLNANLPNDISVVDVDLSLIHI